MTAIGGTGWSGDIGGNVPVQAEGTVDGHPFYFRARGDSYTITVSEAGTDPVTAWRTGGILYQAEGRWFNSGWMDEADAIALVTRHIETFQSRAPEGQPVYPLAQNTKTLVSPLPVFRLREG